MRRLILMNMFLAMSILATIACSKAKDALKSAEDALFSEPAYEPVVGEDATPNFQAVSGAMPFESSALSQALSMSEAESSKETLALLGLELTADSDEIPEVNAGTIGFLKAGTEAKASIKSESFDQPKIATMFKKKRPDGTVLQLTPDEYDQYDPIKDQIKLTDDAWGGKSEIIVSLVDRVSVKNQGERGTCAAHAGVGYLEYLILNKYGSKLTSVDLSEQRFYMMSKPELWASGGVIDKDGGSSWVTGYETSYGKDGKSSPANVKPFNIPLEADCPYVDKAGQNELQVPQVGSCLRGAVQVSSMTTSYYSKSGTGPYEFKSTGAPRKAQEIFDFIKTHNLPVPVGTTLTGNWMDNDGMITLAKSKKDGYGPHAGGHAYLIVGMRKLDQAKFPNEGGMCFIIKNSWGIGWGLNGYSCMTLAWFSANRDSFSFDVALDVNVDLGHLQANATGASPADLPPPTGASVEPSDAGKSGKEAMPVAQEVTDPGTPKGDKPVAGDGGGSPPTVQPAVTADGFSVGRLLTKKGNTVQVLFKKDGAALVLRGVYAGQKASTQDLRLALEGDRLLIDDEAHKKYAVVAGELQSDLVILCAGKYAEVCQLNLLKNENRLVVGVTEGEFRNYEPSLDADYKTLFELANYGLQYSLGDGVFSDFRFIVKGKETNPLRLAIKPVSGGIMFKGQEIGNYQKAEFCSGSFGSVCRVLLDKDQNQINIFLKAKKNT